MHRAALGCLALLATTICAGAALAQDADKEPVKIGVLSDLSSVYQGNSGTGSAVAVKLAIDDFGGTVLGRPIEMLTADHQTKPDVAASIARKWYDVEGVDVITDVVSSGTSAAVSAVAREKQKMFLASNAASSIFNMDQCSPYTVQWRSDTFASAKALTSGLLDQGFKKWFIIAADYNFGHALEKEIGEMVKAVGGEVVGSVRHPVGSQDFSSYILQAQASGAEVVALANAGDDMVNTIKAARDFGLLESDDQKLVSMLVFITDVHAVGLDAMQGLVIESDWYWNMDDRTRDFARRYYEEMGKMPTMSHAANYSAVTQYLKAMQAAGSDKPEDIVAKLHEMPIDDMYARNGRLRDDNLLVHDVYLLQVKAPEDSKEPWDYYDVVATLSGDEAFRPIEASTCPMVEKK